MQQIYQDQQSDLWLICRDKFGERSMIGELEWGHRQFWYNCVIEWGHYCNKCPVCKIRFHRVTANRNGQFRITQISDADLRTEDTEMQQYLDEIKCEMCGGEEDAEHMLLCDSWDSGFHTSCLQLMDIPECESWFWSACLPDQPASWQYEQKSAEMQVRVLPIKRPLRRFLRRMSETVEQAQEETPSFPPYMTRSRTANSQSDQISEPPTAVAYRTRYGLELRRDGDTLVVTQDQPDSPQPDTPTPSSSEEVLGRYRHTDFVEGYDNSVSSSNRPTQRRRLRRLSNQISESDEGVIITETSDTRVTRKRGRPRRVRSSSSNSDGEFSIAQVSNSRVTRRRRLRRLRNSSPTPEPLTSSLDSSESEELPQIIEDYKSRAVQEPQECLTVSDNEIIPIQDDDDSSSSVIRIRMTRKQLEITNNDDDWKASGYVAPISPRRCQSRRVRAKLEKSSFGEYRAVAGRTRLKKSQKKLAVLINS